MCFHWEHLNSNHFSAKMIVSGNNSNVDLEV